MLAVIAETPLCIRKCTGMNRTSHRPGNLQSPLGERKNKADSLRRSEFHTKAWRQRRILGEGGAKEVWLTTGCTFSSEPNKNRKILYPGTWKELCCHLWQNEKMLDQRSFLSWVCEDQEGSSRDVGPGLRSCWLSSLVPPEKISYPSVA